MAIIDVVKWEAPSDLLAWKHPSTDLSTYTQLIVNESQDAFLVSAGVYEGPFPAGRHTLATENLPVLRSLMKLPFGGLTPFSAEVWFVNRATNLDVKWGTPDPVQVQDPKFGVMVPVRAFGQYGVRISDPKRFLLKLVGTLPSFDSAALSDYFRGIFVTRIKTLIATAIVKRGVSVLEITTELDDLSATLQEAMRAEVDEYGVEILKFRIMSINVDEADPAVARLKQALARRAEMSIVGFNYQQERSFDVLQSAASNEGTSGGVMGAGLGAGLGLGLGANIGNVMGGVMVPQPASPVPPQTPHQAPAQQTSTSSAPDLSSKMQLLKELAALREQGVLTEEEFAREKAKVLNS
jgi:membrane protease subunit (stomatin/prohibitin family)